MKKLLVPMFIALAMIFVFSAGASAAGDKQLTPQQQKMADCAHKSKGLKGDEHKKFMSACLKGNDAAAAGEQKAGNEAEKASAKAEDTKAAATSQRNKMKDCNKQASAQKLKGKDRRAFMSSCLKGG